MWRSRCHSRKRCTKSKLRRSRLQGHIARGCQTRFFTTYIGIRKSIWDDHGTSFIVPPDCECWVTSHCFEDSWVFAKSDCVLFDEFAFKTEKYLYVTGKFSLNWILECFYLYWVAWWKPVQCRRKDWWWFVAFCPWYAICGCASGLDQGQCRRCPVDCMFLLALSTFELLNFALGLDFYIAKNDPDGRTIAVSQVDLEVIGWTGCRCATLLCQLLCRWANLFWYMETGVCDGMTYEVGAIL